MRGVKPAPLGSLKDRMMARMFYMEESAKFDQVAAMMMGMAIASGGEQHTMNNMRNLLELHQETVAYKGWSVEASKVKKRKTLTDQNILDKVNRLGDLGRG